MKIAKDVLEIVGSTPIIRLNKITRAIEAATILAKLEFLNPSGSIKDRIALRMIEEAEKKGILKPDTTIVEATSGNTGIALAMVAAVKGYKFIAVMPETMSVERRTLMKAFDADFVLTPGFDPKLAIEKAKEMAEDPGVFMPDQFSNPSNPAAHRETGREILAQTNDKVDAFVAGVGTGGTLVGVAEVLKDAIPDVKFVAVEPASCAVLSGGEPGPHKIQGIGEGFVPEVLKRQLDLIDEVIAVTDEEAIEMARRLAREEGLLAGVSSGANVFAALKIARELGAGKTVVTVLPDSGQRYLTTELYG